MENVLKEKGPEAGRLGGTSAGLWVRNAGLLIQGKGRDGFEGYVGGLLVDEDLGLGIVKTKDGLIFPVRFYPPQK